MVNFLGIFLALIFSFNANAIVSPSGVPATNFGYDAAASVAGATVSDLTTKVALVCGGGNSNVTNGNYYRMVKMGTQSTSQENYQVNNAKTLYCNGFYYSTNGTEGIMFGYGTAAVTNNNSGAPAGEKAFNASNGGFSLASSSIAPKWLSYPMSFPASSYPYCKMSDAAVIANVIVICEEL